MPSRWRRLWTKTLRLSRYISLHFVSKHGPLSVVAALLPPCLVGVVLPLHSCQSSPLFGIPLIHGPCLWALWYR